MITLFKQDLDIDKKIEHIHILIKAIKKMIEFKEAREGKPDTEGREIALDAIKELNKWKKTRKASRKAYVKLYTKCEKFIIEK